MKVFLFAILLLFANQSSAVTSNEALATATAWIEAHNNICYSRETIEEQLPCHLDQGDGTVIYQTGICGMSGTFTKAYVVSFGNAASHWICTNSKKQSVFVVYYDTCSPPSILNSNGTACVIPPDYNCASPKEWIQTTILTWKCVDKSLIPLTNLANITGVYGTSSAYHVGIYNSTECDSDIPYECIIPNCEFWNPLSLINALCK